MDSGRSLALRASRWSAARPAWLDGAVAGVLAVVCVPAGFALADWPGALLSAALTVPLAVRRRHPVTLAVWVAVASVVQLLALEIPLPADLAVGVALYTVAAHVPSRALRLAALAAALGGGVAAGFRWSTPPSYRANALAAATVLTGLAALVWLVGNLVRGREANLRELAAARRQQERLAEAREIHDIVAHSLTVVIVQADAGRFAAAPAEVLDTIGRTARSALAEVRALIDMLRDEPAEADGAGLARLVAAVRAAGLPVRLDAAGAVLDGLPGPVRTAALRTVQESLTNVLQHAGPDATAEVIVARADGAVTVRVVNLGAAGTGSGHGLAGLRERVTELGGTLRAGPRPGGFLVEASIPEPR